MAMNLNKFTEKAQEAVLGAQQLAESLKHPQIEPEHLLVTLVEQDNGVVPALLRKLQLDPAMLARDARTAVGKQPQVHGGSQAAISPRLKLVVDLAQAEAGRLKDEYVSTEHLFLAIAGETGRSPGRAPPAAARPDAGSDPVGAHRCPRQPARDRPEPGEQVPGARTLRPRPDGARPERQARPGHRPRRRDPSRHPGAVAAHQEQPGAHRRARRRQDGRRRGPGPAHRARRRARRAEGQEDHRARHGRACRRREVPRRVRGASEGGPQGDRRLGGTDRPVHRRAAHRRGRGRGRRLARRLEHAQAAAGARRAAHDRRDHARRVPQAHREGRGARAALPAGAGRRAHGRRHDQHPARSCASATRSTTA